MAIKTKKVLPKTHGTNNTITSTINTTGGGSIQLPTTGNNGTGGLYGQFTPTMGNTGDISIVGSNNAPTAPVGAGSLQPITIGGNGAGGAYGDFLTPTLPTTPTNPVYTPIIGGGNSLVGGGSAIGGNLVKPVDPSQYFDGGVVGTVGGGFSGGNKGGVTDEGVITGRLPNADDVTFDNNGFKGTGATFVPPASGGSGSVSNGGTTTGTGAGAGTSTGDSTPTDTKTDTEETGTMTYEEFIAEQKAREEEKRQAALKEAEIYKERAAADAQASYMQNMSTYGVNAETMAQMGLTGGGYSDYLNAQAYAQKRGEMQTASANEAAMKQQAESKYADNILSLDGQLVAYQEAEKAEKEQYAKSVYNTLWDAVQDPNTTYTADSIKAIAEKAGLSEEDITALTGMLDSTLAKKAEDDKKAEEEKAATEQEVFKTNSNTTKSNAISYIIANGGGQAEYIESIKDTLTEEDYNALVMQNQKSTYEYYSVALNSGNNISTSEVDTLYKNGNLSDQQYSDIKALWNNTRGKAENLAFVDAGGNTLSYADAKKLLNEQVKASTWFSDENKKAIESTYMRQYSKDIANEVMPKSSATGTVVDIYAPDFKTTKFGDFTDMGKSGTKQEKYAQAIVSAAKAGKIQAGQYVIMNYGNTWDTDCVFVYIGDGLFVKCKDGNGDDCYATSDGLKSGVSFYVPSDHYLSFSAFGDIHVQKK